MDEFEKLVRHCRINKDTRIIHNAAIQHASILFDNLLDSSKKDKACIRMVSGDLKDDFYNPLAAKFKTCLDNGSKITVVILNGARDLSKNKLARLIEENDNGQLIKKNLGKDAKFPHFILVGQDRFRAETDHKQAKAIASFNSPGICTTLTGLFKMLEPSPSL